MFPILQIGPVAIQTPGLALLAGLWLALRLAEREADRLRARLGPEAGTLSGEALYGVTLAGLAAGIVGARLAYVLRYLDAYLADPLGIVALNAATLAQMEGVLIGLAAAVAWGARGRLPLWPTLDALAPGVAAMGAAIALAHVASGDAFGAPTEVPWRIWLWDEYRHPSQLYELLAALVILGVALWLGRQAEAAGGTSSGVRFLIVVALTAGARLLLEGFRGDSVLLAGGVRAAQVWAWLALAACLALLLSSRGRRAPEAPPAG
jgi:phosphatidylglycerol:prolipoprotein diacylglycerol transferase